MSAAPVSTTLTYPEDEVGVNGNVGCCEVGGKVTQSLRPVWRGRRSSGGGVGVKGKEEVFGGKTGAKDDEEQHATTNKCM